MRAWSRTAILSSTIARPMSSTTASWGSLPSSFKDASRSSRHPGGMALAAAARDATSTIPILFMIGSDPVELGLVKSLSRPGVNLTGVAYFNVEVAAKRLELLHKLVPEAKSIALLVQRGNPLETQVQVRNAESAAKLLGMRLRVFEVSSPSDLDDAFAAVAQEQIDLVHIGVDGLFGNNRARLIGLAARYRVPTSYPWR